MGIRRFRTRRHWHNTKVMIAIAPLLLLVGVILLAGLNLYAPLFVIAAGCFLGLAVALIRDVRKRYTYELDGEVLHITSSGLSEAVGLHEIADASLIDRAAAREYIMGSTADLEPAEQRRRIKDFLKYCTVDIGLTTFTLGVGRGLIDRMPDARHDLVLVRMRDSQDLLLSPEYNQDLVTWLGKQARAVQERG